MEPDTTLIILRLVHIPSAIFWMGATLILFFFISPLNKNEPKIINKIMKEQKLSMWLAISAILTVVSGIMALAHDSKGFQREFMSSTAGRQFSIGGIAGIIAFLIGAFVIGPMTKKLEKLSKSSNTKEFKKLERRLHLVHTVNLLVMILALTLMIIAPEFEA